MTRGARPRHIRLILLLLALSACAHAPERGAAPPLRVMTYNIFAGNDLARESNLTRIAALIDSLGVDIVFLQEVDRRTARSGGTDQAATIAGLTGMHAAFGRAMEFDGGEYGIAILSRQPMMRSRVLPLDAPSSAEPRIGLHVVLTAHGRELHLLNTHLDHRADAAARRVQADLLLRYVTDSIPGGAPLIAGGDLNATPDAQELRGLLSALVDAWQRCGSGTGHTFRADRPDRRIDYVLLRGAVCSVAAVPATTLSDHLPVIVDVLLDGMSIERR
jgi:endonuclease/exonuclease/phosphatase family metal-dependent hydrolase